MQAPGTSASPRRNQQYEVFKRTNETQRPTALTFSETPNKFSNEVPLIKSVPCSYTSLSYQVRSKYYLLLNVGGGRKRDEESACLLQPQKSKRRKSKRFNQARTSNESNSTQISFVWEPWMGKH